MREQSKTTARLISAAIFILLEIAAINMLKSSSALQNVWINRASHRVMGAFWQRGEHIRGYFSLEKQNAILARENAELSDELRAYREAEAAGIVDKQAKKFGDNYSYLPASIVKMSRNQQHNYIIIDKGSLDGVEPQTGIITNQGVVGIIDAVDRHYSYGLTLMNANVSVSARLGRSGVVAPLVWDGIRSNGAVMKEVPLHASVEPGDTVWTSGFSSIFPPDVPLGVTVNTKTVSGSTNNIVVELFQDFSSLRYVTVVENLQKAEIGALERQEVRK